MSQCQDFRGTVFAAADAANHRFFKVEVAMPDGATAADAPGPVGGEEIGEL
jgi:hypothetical protein